ncbi:hypothetical protein CIL03_08755 [Virgibacillus indicus]|uniref:LysM domain-containing protein n=1 Tax=Virgibacillus indicus TaxID=2024554 RepID=A0A265NAR9_9BACI|nr:DUF6448 family protein [Virgibacillus indicus]OZU89093.1 hypothetical protein CIL03_08755 [Virgibacillus indicus]
MKFKSKMVGTALLSIGLIVGVPTLASAHCDTPEGPTYDALQAAIDEGNFDHIAYWVLEEDEEELRNIYDHAISVMEKSDDEEIDELAERYLFENFVRIHRAGEGAPYTGISHEPVEPGIAAADESIAQESLQPLEDGGFITDENRDVAESAFEELLAHKDFDVEDTEAGREYVNAYVIFTHLFEEGHGEEHSEGHDHEDGHVHGEEAHGDTHAEESTPSHAASHEGQTSNLTWEARTVDEIKADLPPYHSIEDLQIYKVVWGDTLWGISQATGFTVEELSEAFHITNPDLIFANDILGK